MAWLPVKIAMILGHQDLTLGEGSGPCNGGTYTGSGAVVAK
jgi:hypothetical protein